jgi:Transposase IS66 family
MHAGSAIKWYRQRRRGGLATPALLAQVLVSKYCDHTPLYRQSQIFARHGVDLSRSTLAGWVGGACWWLEALHERLCKNVFAWIISSPHCATLANLKMRLSRIKWRADFGVTYVC